MLAIDTQYYRQWIMCQDCHTFLLDSIVALYSSPIFAICHRPATFYHYMYVFHYVYQLNTHLEPVTGRPILKFFPFKPPYFSCVSCGKSYVKNYDFSLKNQPVSVTGTPILAVCEFLMCHIKTCTIDQNSPMTLRLTYKIEYNVLL